MAADRGRDLQFRVLSDLSELDTDGAARQLDDLGDAGDRAGRKLDDALDTSTRKLDDLDRAARDTGRGVDDGLGTATRSTEDFGDQARDTARRVDDAFDAIKRSSRTNLKAVDDDLDKAGRGLDDFKEEAAGSGREAAASFQGGFDDITGFVQETAANAFSGFGPLGAAAGVAAALGIGVITKVFQDSKDRAEEAKQEISDWVQAFVDGQGRIQEATIQSKLQDLFGDPERYKQIATDAREAGIGIELYGRALAGDVSALQAVKEKTDAASEALDANQSRTTESEAATLRQANALKRVQGELGLTKGSLDSARNAYRDLDNASRAGITMDVRVDAPTPSELDAINRRIRSGIGTVVVPVEAGQSRFTNNANNSRYRW